MKKIAFIIVRYGENINGGAEVHCQMLAERLLPYYEVEVLTTTIRAFNHPDQDYTEGVSSWNGVTIRRFKPQPIDQEQFRPFRKKYKTARRIRQYLKKLNLLRAASFLHPEWKSGIENERPSTNRQRPMPRACCVISKATRLNMQRSSSRTSTRPKRFWDRSSLRKKAC